MRLIEARQEARLGRRVEEQLHLAKEVKREVRRDKREFCKKLAIEGWKGAKRLGLGFEHNQQALEVHLRNMQRHMQVIWSICGQQSQCKVQRELHSTIQ